MNLGKIFKLADKIARDASEGRTEAFDLALQIENDGKSFIKSKLGNDFKFYFLVSPVHTDAEWQFKLSRVSFKLDGPGDLAGDFASYLADTFGISDINNAVRNFLQNKYGHIAKLIWD